MNALEKLVYNLFKQNPRLKNKIRNLYQDLFSLASFKESYAAGQLIEHPGYFFGFHDISPFSADNLRLAGNAIKIPLRMPSGTDPLGVGYFSGSAFNNYHEMDTTRAWNWHKGCRLQWRGTSNDLVYNSFDEDIGYHSRLCNLKQRRIDTLAWPIDTVNNRGTQATSFS